MKRGLQLSTKEARQLVEILGEYQNELEAAIECHTLEDGSTPPIDPDAAPLVAECRRKWKRAEDWVKRLSGETSAALPQLENLSAQGNGGLSKSAEPKC